MRDFRDAKAMAHALRDALKTKSVETTHSECLELIAKAFGYDNWNILSAKIEAAQPRQGEARAPSSPDTQDAARKDTVFCSFCARSQHDMRVIIAGPQVYICDECVDVCNDVLDHEGYRRDEDILSLLKADEESGDRAYPTAFEQLRNKSTEELATHVERSRKGTERYRLSLQCIERLLAVPDDDQAAAEELLASPRFAWLKNKARGDLVALRQQTERQLKRYEDALRIAVTVLDGRGR